jgi:hypothetical protein
VRKFYLLIGGALLFTVMVSAQEAPRYEAYLGFQYVRANQFNQNFGLGQTIGGFDMYGGDGQFTYNFNKWIGGVVDAGGVNKPNVGFINVANTTAFVYGGPRFYFRKLHGFAPFGEILFGGAFRHASKDIVAVTSINTPTVVAPNIYPPNLFPGPLTVVNAKLTNTEDAFSMKVGGGLDYRLGKHFSIRLPEVDYVLTRFPSLFTGVRENQSSIAASAGIVFTWGAQ